MSYITVNAHCIYNDNYFLRISKLVYTAFRLSYN